MELPRYMLINANIFLWLSPDIIIKTTITICLAFIYVCPALCWILLHICIQTYRTYTASFNFHIDLEINILPIKFTYWNVRFLLKVAWLVRRKTHKLNIKLIRVFNHHISSKQFHHQIDKLGVVTEQQNQIRHLLGSVGEIRWLGITCEVHLIGNFRSPFRWRAETAYASRGALCTESWSPGQI